MCTRSTVAHNIFDHHCTTRHSAVRTINHAVLDDGHPPPRRTSIHTSWRFQYPAHTVPHSPPSRLPKQNSFGIAAAVHQGQDMSLAIRRPMREEALGDECRGLIKVTRVVVDVLYRIHVVSVDERMETKAVSAWAGLHTSSRNVLWYGRYGMLSSGAARRRVPRNVLCLILLPDEHGHHLDR